MPIRRCTKTKANGTRVPTSREDDDGLAARVTCTRMRYRGWRIVERYAFVELHAQPAVGHSLGQRREIGRSHPAVEVDGLHVPSGQGIGLRRIVRADEGTAVAHQGGDVAG